MDIDELMYNVFYLLLRNEYRKKYDLSLSKCWTICVPCADSLRDVSITKEFIDDHVLKPQPDSKEQFTSTDENETHVYKIEDDVIKLINDDTADNRYAVNIISVEKGYNNEYQPYNIFILDKPLHRKYRVTDTSCSKNLQLNMNVTSYKEAKDFLQKLSDQNSCPFDDLRNDVETMDLHQCKTVVDLKETLHKLISNYWAITMRQQSLDIQRDARFQKLLSLCLELYVMNGMHDDVYSILSNSFIEEDSALKQKIDQLNDMNVSQNQPGLKESSACSMPVAMVELATLDSLKGPLSKLFCLRSSLDFIVAEIKVAMADMEFRTNNSTDSDDNLKTYDLNTEDLIFLLLDVMIKCRFQKLYTDSYYMEHFTWSISPNDVLSYALVTFKAAISLLEELSVNELYEKMYKVITKLNLNPLHKTMHLSETRSKISITENNLEESMNEDLNL